MQGCRKSPCSKLPFWPEEMSLVWLLQLVGLPCALRLFTFDAFALCEKHILELGADCAASLGEGLQQWNGWLAYYG